jgi:hypothetical protein
MEGRDAPLWHGVKTSFVKTQLQENSISGHTMHRYWPDGKYLQDKTPGYQESFWMKGISTSRDMQYAANWAGSRSVVYKLDQRLIAQNYKMIPISWGATIQGHTKNLKKEREEFIVLNKTKQSFDDFLEQYHKERDALDDAYYDADMSRNKTLADKIMTQIKSRNKNVVRAWQQPGPNKLFPLSKYLLGIYMVIDPDYDDTELLKDDIKYIQELPQYKGTITIR